MPEKEQRNLLLAFALSFAILVAFQFLMPTKPHPRPVPVPVATEAPGTAPLATVAPPASHLMTREEALAAGNRVKIETPSLHGSINLTGAQLDDLILVDYRETVDPTSPPVRTLSPAGAPDPYKVETGWIAPTPGIPLPGEDTPWQADGTLLTPTQPVTLTWDNGAGLIFTRHIAVDANFVFTIDDAVHNAGAAPVELRPFALISRTGLPKANTGWSTNEGAIGVFGGTEIDARYEKLPTDQPTVHETTGGWLGFNDMYWLTAIAPGPQDEPFRATFTHTVTGTVHKLQADYLGAAIPVAAGAEASHRSIVFSGAKRVKLLSAYSTDLHLPLFENAVDFGRVLYLITKPLFYLLDWIYGQTNNFGIAILILTVIVRGVFFPLQTKAVMNLNKMKVLQPEMAKLKEKFGDDKARLNQEVMALYKRIGANPLAGCLPILLQIPVFFALYNVLSVNIEMRHAPFFGWIRDLSAPDPTSLFNLFGLIPFSPPSFLMIGAWPAIYCGVMYMQQRMQPAPPDPVQARMMQFMPFFLTFMMGKLPAGLVIYYSWSMTLGIGQQWLITRRTAKMAAATPS
jgi:YidC/Oxa1 family membrane protein insertase